MSIRKYAFASEEFYHIYNRGTDKRCIFLDDNDHRHFIELLFLSNSKLSINVREIKKYEKLVYDFERGPKLVHIGAYCLMPNHFHILLTPATEGGVQLFMQKLATAYAMYFNHRYERTGGLFEGKFKARWADSDEYLKYLLSYIHLNPVKLMQQDWKEVGIQNSVVALQYLEGYKYSSFANYDGAFNIEGRILNREVFPDYFKHHKNFRKEILEWINFDES